ncbi:MAG: amidohydrolase family protein [Deltaproteobacteria bacterium]
MSATLLLNGTVVDLDPVHVERRDVVLHGAEIKSPDEPFPTTATIDCTDCLIVPGFVVAHTHLYSGLATGMPPPPHHTGTFRQILEHIWWRLDRALDADTLRSSVRVAALHAIRSGTTCLIDHHESPNFIDGSLDVIAEELDAIGLRACLTYGATDRHGPDGARAGLDESERFTKKVEEHPTLRGAIGLHAPFTCAVETMESAADRATLHRAWLHYHAAEGPDDQFVARERGARSLFEQLEGIGLVNNRAIAAHAVDVNEREREIIGNSGVWVTHQARSNMNNGVGYAQHLLQLDRVALGTDGIDNDLLEENRAAFFRAREQTGPTEWPDVVRRVAKGHQLAGEIFGTPAFGRLSRGAPADVVVLDYPQGTPIDPDNVAGHLLFGWRGANVRDVFVAGRPLLRNRKLVTLDERNVLDESRAMARRLWQQMEAQ